MSFLSSAGHFFSKLFTNAPTWSQTASVALTLTAPLISSILMFTSGEQDAAQVTAVIQEVQADLTAAAALISQAHGGADVTSAVSNALNAVTSNLDTLLKAGHIKDPATLNKVKAAVTTVSAEVQAILAVLPKK